MGAGFVRNAVWDHLHNYRTPVSNSDVDVIWYDKDLINKLDDDKIERRLNALLPSINWSVKNQARMHVRNGDAPYASATDAMRFWPETATAVAAQRNGRDGLHINAPFELDDLFGLKLRPTPNFVKYKRGIFDSRIEEKGWLTAYPLLQP